MAKALSPVFTRKVVIKGGQWKFVVYPDSSYTLLDPNGRHVPPPEHLDRGKIDALRTEAGHPPPEGGT